MVADSSQDGYSLQEIAKIIDAELLGDPNHCVLGIAALEDATKQDVAFIGNNKYKKYLKSTQAGAVILTSQDIAECCAPNLLVSENPRLALTRLASFFIQKRQQYHQTGIHTSAVVSSTAVVAASVTVGAHCVIGAGSIIEKNVILKPGVVIGDYCVIKENSVLEANVTLYDRVKVGRSCVIHSGTVIGSEGFGYAFNKGIWVKTPHLGGVTIGDQVEIGSNTSIDRGFLNDTEISDHVIIDNLVQIAHNVYIGKGTAIAGCTGIAGSTRIGQYCLIGGGVKIAGHLQISDKVNITGASNVNRSLQKPGTYSSGFPAKENNVWNKNVARFNVLDQLINRLKVLEFWKKQQEEKAES